MLINTYKIVPNIIKCNKKLDSFIKQSQILFSFNSNFLYFHNKIKRNSLMHTPSYSYHRNYLMDSKYDDRYVKIDRNSFKLYKQSILSQQKFNQKKFLIIFIDCVRSKQKYQDFQQLTQYGIKNLNYFIEPLSIVSFSQQLFLYNYSNKQKCFKVADKLFKMFKNAKLQNKQIKFPSYHMMKFLLFIQKNIGLQKFNSQQYQLINFQMFKPLFLCFTLEMFHEKKLQHYKVIQNLFQLFIKSQKMIPYIDLHHLKMATKNIKNQRFIKFVQKLNGKYQDKVVRASSNLNEQERKVTQEGVNNQFINSAQNQQKQSDLNNNHPNLSNNNRIQFDKMYSLSIKRKNTKTAFDFLKI